MGTVSALPRSIGGIDVPQDDVSMATWNWAHRALPEYLRRHSIRSFFWAAEIATGEGWPFDRAVLWAASLMHDVGLARLATNTMCFDVEGAEIARRFLEREGMTAEAVDRVAIAMILHMQPNVTLGDGVESVLLDRATGIDVRGTEYDAIRGVRDGVMEILPRGAFDRHFLRAMTREALARPTCQSVRLVHETDLEGWMARSPWRTAGEGTR